MEQPGLAFHCQVVVRGAARKGATSDAGKPAATPCALTKSTALGSSRAFVEYKTLCHGPRLQCNRPAPEQWRRFAATGITHLISISGLHITLLAGLGAGAGGSVWRRIPPLAARLGAPRVRLVAAVATALCYSLLAGFSIPTRRTLLMILVAAICLWRAAPVPPSAVWVGALALVTLFDPFAVLAPGFWLSFLTVGALLWLGGNRDGTAPWWQRWGGAQWAATLASLPLLVFLFQQVPLVSPLANAVAIPLVSLVVTPLALAGLLDPSGLLLVLAERTFAFTDWLLGWLAGLPHATWSFMSPPWWALPPAAAGVLLCLLPRGVPGRGLAPVLLLPLLVPRHVPLPHGAFSATVFDVGQGLAVLIRTRNHALLYDTGPPGMAERAILPSLHALGVRQLDRLVVSHDDNDHAGGALTVLTGMPVTDWRSGLPPAHPARGRPIPHAACVAGQRWQWDGVQLTMLWPRSGDRIKDDNAASCVLRIGSGRHSLLLPGDIGRTQEQALIEGGLGRTTMVIAPHHGSRISSSSPFVAATAPAWVVYSAGYRNRFRHPNRTVTERYAAHGAQALRTDGDGAVHLTFSDTVTIERWRERHPRYWRPRPAP
ncbi:DNA internalization-related competence protein ComEC/Rec2 [Chitiniphilus purpureus]|uniref:DNA internalization-related competence protein ComEC/Rec2 n=1 Tax=Chitiniphilus purpureus TaxID=2981137 RepID=A0ABY6DQJ7_9NEIS|nr:DNA internalization-related competence protein ComEC/Rec2 [Chitiniphilus sp. CD1]UXY16636.1 DNA internalization-related competence protein ComEC/Rec2 [Chitiniphilus sp. CD1]